MKKIILTMALAVSMFSFAQDKPEEGKGNLEDKRFFTVLINGGSSVIFTPPVSQNNSGIGNLGVSFELQTGKFENVAHFLNLNYATATVSSAGAIHKSGGYGVEIGFLNYLSIQSTLNRGPYFGFSLSYVNCKFTDTDYSGAYSYAGFGIPLGFRGIAGKHFVFDLSITGLFKVEMQPSGNVNNQSFVNNEVRPQLKMGYRF